MKIGSFIVGGLAGAAVVMLMQRNGRMMAMAGTAGESLKRRAGEMKGEALGRLFSMGTGGERGWSGKDQSRERGENEGLGHVAKLASQDSEVKRQVDKILEENAKHPN
ncbi:MULTISPECIES: hypothetical protein [Cohnella]|uniref:hypothetical protein n=1 Tax=Cohnella TaxID=329857 RepID=UPI0009BBEE4D|nr:MULTISPECIES: hypothetical protein [Cohnella]MBN2984343.1 hypothetical protein [Cohnella algarum]